MKDHIVTTGEVAKELGAELSGSAGVAVSDATHDSRQAREGTLFAAIRGLTMD